MALIIQNGEIVTSKERYVADIRVEGEQIAQIGQHVAVESGDTVINAGGKYIFPGGIDAHTHLDLPFMGTTAKDDFATGTIAAVAGGTTCIIDFVIPDKSVPMMDGFAQWMAKAEGKSVIDYGFHLAVTWWDKSVQRELGLAYNAGMTSFKTFLAYKGAIGIEDSELYQIMGTAKELGGAMVTVHAENAEIVWQLQQKLLAEGKTQPIDHAHSRPPIVEAEGTHRAITMAAIHDAPVFIVHMSTADALEKVRDARFRGQHVYVETCPQYLLLDESLYRRPNWEGAKWVMSPPLREKYHQTALWNGIRAGLVHTIATDHCPFDFHGQKDMGGTNNFAKIPNGIPGIGDRMQLMYTYGVTEGRIDLHHMIDLCCTAPARIFGLSPKKGTIAVGSDADLVVFDPHYEGTITAKSSLHRVDYSAFEGMPVRGKTETTIVRGTVRWQNGTFLGNIGGGRYLHRGPSGQHGCV